VNTRLLIVAAMLLAGSGYVTHATHAEDPVSTKQSLATLPLELGKWRGQESPAMASNVLKVLGVDEYLNRVYLADREPFVSLYVGFYASQRQGDTIHSPLNCLPGAGWQPVVQDRITIPVSDASGSIRSITINQFVIQKGLERQIVLYWYQSHGRVIASEYASKIYMVYDAMRLNRTDAALVRVITPILDVDIATEPAAAARATEFVQRIFPILNGVLPS
jgi:EpsI family protein